MHVPTGTPHGDQASDPPTHSPGGGGGGFSLSNSLMVICLCGTEKRNCIFRHRPRGRRHRKVSRPHARAGQGCVCAWYVCAGGGQTFAPTWVGRLSTGGGGSIEPPG